jgi:hypothetical protein
MNRTPSIRDLLYAAAWQYLREALRGRAEASVDLEGFADWLADTFGQKPRAPREIVMEVALAFAEIGGDSVVVATTPVAGTWISFPSEAVFLDLSERLVARYPEIRHAKDFGQAWLAKAFQQSGGGA